jgi:hypothetical protein
MELAFWELWLLQLLPFSLWMPSFKPATNPLLVTLAWLLGAYIWNNFGSGPLFAGGSHCYGQQCCSTSMVHFPKNFIFVGGLLLLLLLQLMHFSFYAGIMSPSSFIWGIANERSVDNHFLFQARILFQWVLCMVSLPILTQVLYAPSQQQTIMLTSTLTTLLGIMNNVVVVAYRIWITRCARLTSESIPDDSR